MNLKKIKNIIRRQKHSTSTYDLTDNKHPLDMIYDSFKGSAALIPMENCRSNMLGFTPAGNPFVETLIDYSTNKSHYSGSKLENYYKHFCPSSMKTVLDSNNPILEKYHPMATVMPWSTSTPEEKFLRACVDVNASNILSNEAQKHGLTTEKDYGWQYFGPVSEELGKTEYTRLTSVYENILQNDYKPERYGYIHGQFLIHDNKWVWVNIGGKHRFATLAALGFTAIPIALKSRSSALYINRSDVDYWPNVKNGLFSKADALNIFDRLMHGTSYISLINSK